MDTGHSSSRVFISSSIVSNWVYSDTNTSLNVEINPFILQDGDPANFVIGLESASIPLSIWTVNEDNNTLRLNAKTINIDYGNYNINGLIDYLNAYNDGIFNNTGVFVFSYDSVNNRISIISYDPAFPSSITVGSATTCQKILGVVVGTYTTIDPTTTKPIYRATNQVNLTYTTGILISINNIQTSNRDNQAIGSGGTILNRIPINCPLYRILTFYNPQPFYTTIANRVITNLEIRLLNDDYTPLVLQGNPNYNLCFRIDYVKTSGHQVPPTVIQRARQQQQQIMKPVATFTQGDLSTRAKKALGEQKK
jgi:hypothetical protein